MQTTTNRDHWPQLSSDSGTDYAWCVICGQQLVPNDDQFAGSPPWMHRRCDRCGEHLTGELAEIVTHQSETFEEAMTQPHLFVHVGCMLEGDLLA